MNISILYNRDLYACKALNLLLPHLAHHRVSLFHSLSIGRSGQKRAQSLAPLAATERALLMASHSGDETARFKSFESLGASYDVPDESLDDINTPDGLARLGDTAPDIMLSIRFGRILRPKAIEQAAFGVINLHSGPLPAYRGVMPTFWSMLARDYQLGMTLHWITDATIDTGPIIAQSQLPVAPSDSYLWNVWRLYDGGVALMLDAVAKVEAGLRAPAVSRSEEPLSLALSEHAGNYYSFPTDYEVGRFLSESHVLYDSATLTRIRSDFGV